MMLKPFSVLFLTFISISFAKISNSKYYLYEVTPENENASYIRYEPTWRSIDSRPLPSWYDKAKIGIFIHWGVFSVPSFGAGKDHSAGEWFWAYWKGNNQQQVEFMEKNYPPNFKYQEFAPDFKAELYDPDQWADLFVKSGAKYVVLTSKHHDGYTLWPSQYSYSWNAKDVGPGRDVLGELAEAVRSKGLTFGLYHSLLEWYNPMYLSDKASNWQNSTFVDTKVIPEMKELVEAYKPSVLWSDGDWEASDEYWKATEFLAWLYNESPIKDEVVVNDRWGIDIPCAHGGFYTCSDRYNPGTLQPHKWENAMTIDWSSWGFRRNAVLSDYMSIFNLIEELTQTVSCGGNILINIGPTAYGTIAPIYEERLTQLGEWLAINGEAIYESAPWSVQNDTLANGVWYTSKGNAVYAISLHWPEGNVLELGSVNELVGSVTNLVLLGNEDLILNVNRGTDSVSITFPDKSVVHSETAYVLKFT